MRRAVSGGAVVGGAAFADQLACFDQSSEQAGECSAGDLQVVGHHFGGGGVMRLNESQQTLAIVSLNSRGIRPQCRLVKDFSVDDPVFKVAIPADCWPGSTGVSVERF